VNPPQPERVCKGHLDPMKPMRGYPISGRTALRWAVLLALSVPADAATQKIHFNREIRPILSENCFHCHGPDSGKRKAGLRLDTKEGLYGGTKEEGPVLTPGNPAKSALWSRIVTTDADDLMPPPESHRVVTAEQKATLKRWIEEGAPWQPHWAFVRPERAPLPAVQNASWVRNPIDRFVLAKLDAMGLKPAPEADRRTLARRVALDLTGLPPTPAEVDAFVKDKSPKAYENLVDRLLDSSAWGEHRGRYWLDAARYADTHGLHFDNYREMWPYRDWVIRAFNRNQRFDQFTVEQLAGDLLPGATDDQLVASGFHRCNMTTNEGGTIEEENLANYARDRVETTSWVWLGLTANCASCHDHKFDPVSTKDFYSMAAYFRNTTQGGFDGNVKDSNPSVVVPQSATERARWKQIPDDIAGVKKRLENRRRDSRPEFERWLASATAESTPTGPSESGLLVHAVLNDGAGDELKIQRGPQASVRTAKAGEWKSGGRLGPALVLTPETTPDLGDVGDFERDQPFSYGAWVRVPSGGTYQSVLARMDQSRDYQGWDLFTHDRNYAVHLVNAWPANALKVVTTENPLKPGEWQHVFVTYDGSGKPAGLKIFINGKAARTRGETDTLTGSIRTQVPLRVGQRSKDQLLANGQVQDVRVYGRTLQPDEVRSLAEDAPTRLLLALPASQRTPAKVDALYEFYLSQKDPGFFLTRDELAKIEAERDAIRSRSPVTHVQREKMDSTPTAKVLFRGQYDKPKDTVVAGPFAVLNPLPPGSPTNRLGLARWIVAPENPLTARVTVNRFWQEVFGAGIVRTTEDFGVVGDTPANQELLDWLAVEFQNGGWDVKQLFRLMVTSAAYRQSGQTTPEKIEKDPANRYLSRGPRFRMDAEMVRDYALAVSGLANRKIGGPSVKPYQPDGVWEAVAMPESNTKKYERDRGESLYRRSLYTFWKRAAPPAMMDVFNAPSRETCSVRRERTNTPLQALATLNDIQFMEAARVLAQDVLKRHRGDDTRLVEQMALRVLLRPLKPTETPVITATLQDLRNHYAAHPDEAKELLAYGEAKADPGLPPDELAAATLVANQLLNLDEALNK